ncbi:recombinase family protein [Amycolatopsis roodepoortensis]|uniref:recombinase family protein n=1 Tax=Amycolatopsis roodepoortensis TaxID=700274 RepID=UPI00214B66BD|nr:recombinase family protein [Amycolatopsis roodepoortensis]UUV32953.1 recombinase family protein [Amycolatopsis roodepoortensis]
MMASVALTDDGDGLELWVAGKRRLTDRTGGSSTSTGLRFAFYGRTSTVRHQDRTTSQGWQREAAELLVAGRGTIVGSFFDAGCSRRVQWKGRRQAARLLDLVADGGVDAIVVGEYERAFSGTQFQSMYGWFARHGVQVWLPETDGPVDLGDPDHRALLSLLGAQSQREVLRARHRVLAAMHNQAAQQGRYLGGRPPYGYRLVDAGRHPNQDQAHWGRRLQQLAPDPVTAPHVVWMFAERLAGRSRSRIARELNARGVPCPSKVDPGRNRHRTGGAWTLRTVAVILANPRYTGRQVWGRRPTTPDSSRSPAVSRDLAHPALVSEEDFLAAQQVRSARTAQDGAIRRYALAGLVRCGVCARRMDSHWVHDRPGYRCRHGHSSARQPATGRPKTIYLREDHLIDRIAAHFGDLDDHDARDHARARVVAAELRATGAIVVCDSEGVTRVSECGFSSYGGRAPKTNASLK